MIKQEIIDRLAKKHRLSNRYAKELVDSVFELLEDGIKRDGKVTITRFGTFYVRVYKPKLGRDLRKGELFRTKETPVTKFRASIQMAERIKGIMRWDGVKKKAAGIFLILLSVLLTVVAVLLLKRGQESVLEAEEKETVEQETEGSVPVKAYSVIADDMELLKKYQDYNADVVGIIRIPGTVLNHPVMQTRSDEEYYLMRGLDKQYNPHGVPFLSARSEMEGKGGNRIIYGHNIHKKTRDIFCDLAGYEDLAFYQEHPIIETVSESGTRQWLIFAYYLVDNADDEPFKYSDTVDFLSMAAYTAYMDEVGERNWLCVPYEHSIDDTYLTLSSCSNELAGSGTNRMVVMAVQIPYGLDISAQVADTVMAEEPRLPDKLSK